MRVDQNSQHILFQEAKQFRELLCWKCNTKTKSHSPRLPILFIYTITTHRSGRSHISISISKIISRQSAMLSRATTQQQQLVNLHQRVRKKTIRNRLLLVSACNLLTFLCLVVAMCVHRWCRVRMCFDQLYDTREFVYWVNLLYMREDVDGAPYQSFAAVEAKICRFDIRCSAVLFGFRFAGYLCCSVFGIAAALQVTDLGKMVYYALSRQVIVETKASFMHMVLIGTYGIGISLSAFCFSITSDISIEFGVCFWVFVGALLAFCSAIVYGEFSLRKMVKQALIQNLLNLEKEARVEQLKTEYKLPQEEQYSESSQNKLTL